MDALELLLQRRSQPRLEAPAPEGETLENIMQAALRVPDHGGLQPWRYRVFEGEGRERLGAIFKKSAVENGKNDNDINRASLLPLRAPMVIVAYTAYQQSEKVPAIEQVASASCAVMVMQMAAQAQGFSGIWRTGAYAQCECVKRELGITDNDDIIGFLYLGTSVTQPLPSVGKDSREFFEFVRE